MEAFRSFYILGGQGIIEFVFFHIFFKISSILVTVLLSHVRVLVGGVGRSLDIGFVNQTLDALLDHADGGGKTSFGLTQNLSREKYIFFHLRI